MVTKHFLSPALALLTQARQVTSFCGVRPILHRDQERQRQRVLFLMEARRYSASSLTDSLRSVVRLRRAEGTESLMHRR
ncbi:hypothetical protein FZI40_20560 [Cronobacter sakazakii]|nr:hypothetical protein FZI40_20560 [Cronobacter sakazakii]